MSRPDSPIVAPEHLLRGALFALEQCGQLLTDAVVLAEAGRYPTARGLALLAREEQGRHKLLLERWRLSLGGASITVEGVRKLCGDHVKKQDRGQASVMYRGQSGDQLDRWFRQRRDSRPGSAERHAADEWFRLYDERRKAQQPHERHNKRMESFYVDIVDDHQWSRPVAVSAKDGADEVVDAVNDYARARERIAEAWPLHEDVQLSEAVAALAGPPVVLPSPPWLSIAAALPSVVERQP